MEALAQKEDTAANVLDTEMDTSTDGQPFFCSMSLCLLNKSGDRITYYLLWQMLKRPHFSSHLDYLPLTVCFFPSC